MPFLFQTINEIQRILNNTDEKPIEKIRKAFERLRMDYEAQTLSSKEHVAVLLEYEAYLKDEMVLSNIKMVLEKLKEHLDSRGSSFASSALQPILAYAIYSIKKQDPSLKETADERLSYLDRRGLYGLIAEQHRLDNWKNGLAAKEKSYQDELKRLGYEFTPGLLPPPVSPPTPTPTSQLELQDRLVVACNRNELKKIQELFEQGAKPDMPNQYGEQPLGKAVRAMHPETVALLIKLANGIAPMTWEECEQHNRKHYKGVFVWPDGYQPQKEAIKSMITKATPSQEVRTIATDMWDTKNNRRKVEKGIEEQRKEIKLVETYLSKWAPK